MPTFTHEFDSESYKGKTSFQTGLFIGGEFVDGIEGKTLECVPPLPSALPLCDDR
jgi:aldehyde dehydrogenase (NAD+)